MKRRVFKKKKTLQRELEVAKDDVAYWHGRAAIWREAYEKLSKGEQTWVPSCFREEWTVFAEEYTKSLSKGVPDFGAVKMPELPPHLWSIMRGLQDSAAGRVHDLGSFEQYAEDDVNDGQA